MRRRPPSEALERRWARQDRLFKQFLKPTPEPDNAKAPVDPGTAEKPSDQTGDGGDVPKV